MHRTRITIGEVEHGGDVDFTCREARKVEGVESIEFERFADSFTGTFVIEHTFPRSELRDRLRAESDVCV